MGRVRERKEGRVIKPTRCPTRHIRGVLWWGALDTPTTPPLLFVRLGLLSPTTVVVGLKIMLYLFLGQMLGKHAYKG